MTLKSKNPRAALISRMMFGLSVGFTSFILLLLVLVTGYLVVIGWRSVNVALFTKDPIAQNSLSEGKSNDVRISNPTVGAQPATSTAQAVPSGFPGGMRNGIVGTLILISLASLGGIPVGMLTGVYLSEYKSRLATPVRFVSDVLTGVPSIVVGILGYQLLVVPMGHESGWAGALALAFIMVPIVARTTEEMLRLVPNSYREASIALGATKARTILRVIVPAATGSIITGVMLAIARVAGETAPLLFTAAGSQYFTLNPNERFPSLTQQIYENANAAPEEQHRLAWGGMLVLIAMIFCVNLLIRYFARSRHKVAI